MARGEVICTMGQIFVTMLKHNDAVKKARSQCRWWEDDYNNNWCGHGNTAKTM